MKAFIVLLLLYSSVCAVAQSQEGDANLLAEGDRYFSEEQYNLAIQYYRTLSDKSGQDPALSYKLAEGYRKTFSYGEAEAYYLKAWYQSGEQNSNALYYYALMLKLNGNFDESVRRFSQFILMAQNQKELADLAEQAVVDQAGSEMAKAEQAHDAAAYPLKNTAVNTPYNDYAPAMRDSNTLVITSSRVESNRTAIDERYGEAYTDNYYFTKTNGAWQDHSRQVFEATNSRYNDGSGSFSADGTKYYFTVCGKGGPECRVYVSKLIKNRWGAPEALNENINTNNSESRHPAISVTGDTLLFSSNRRGGAGGYDIWMSISDGNEHWGPAMNLGPVVNTKMNELAPSFVGLKNVFFLASDGHQNYGGLDLYMVKRLSNGSMAVYNLDAPFNSNRDDCFLSFTEHRLYFSSNRDAGKGGFDIYDVPISSPLSFVSKMSLKKRDARGDVKLVARTAHVKNLDLLTALNEDKLEYENLTYDKRKIVDRMVASRTGGAPLNREGFKSISDDEFSTLQRIAERQMQKAELEKRYRNSFIRRIVSSDKDGKEVTVTGVLIDSVSQKLMSGQKIFLMEESGEVVKITTTNESGQFRFTNLPAGKSFYLRVGQSTDWVDSHPGIRQLVFTPTQNVTEYGLENIYFDFDHYTLRPEAESILGELAAYLKKYPPVQLEIYAYADDQGSDTYNMALTQRRGETVMAWLLKSGVDQTGMAVIAKGRQQNENPEKDIQRQVDRRVEFYLNGVTEQFPQTTKTFILKKKSDWNSLSTITGIPVDELQQLNGYRSSGNQSNPKKEIESYQPVRIPLRATTIPENLFFTIH